MAFRDFPIRRKLMAALLLTSGAVLLSSCTAFVTYEVVTLRKGMLEAYATRARIIAANSTASLAFQNVDDATEVLGALKTDSRVMAACLYDNQGKVFAKYPSDAPPGLFPAATGDSGYRGGYLETFCPVAQEGRNLGTVYVRSDLSQLADRYRAYAWLAALIILASALLAFLLSRSLQGQISGPILNLAETAKAVSSQRDFSVRAQKFSRDELGFLTDAFNKMLSEIQVQNQAIQASEANYREIFEKANDAIFVREIGAGRVLSVNQKAMDMTGYSREELTSPHPPGLSSGKAGFTEGDEARWLKKATEEGPQVFEWQARRKDGSLHWMEVSLSRAVIGGQERLLAFFRDIGDRKKIEEINRLGQAQAIETIKDCAILMLDPEGQILTWNQGAESIKGYKASEIVGKSFTTFYTPEDREKGRPQELLKTAVRNGLAEDEGWRVKKDGSKFLADVVITALKDEKGTLRGFIKVARDVTEIRKAQREVWEKTQLLDSVLRNIGDGVCVANEKGEFLMFNEAAERLLGLGPLAGGPSQWTEQYGVYQPDWKTPLPAPENPLAKAIQGESTNDVEVVLRNARNPEGILVSVDGRPLKDQKGVNHGGVVVFHDITEQKRQQELRMYTKALEVSNRELQDFVFVASHDLQEPLRKVQSFGEFLAEECGPALGDNGRDYLERMRSAAGRMQTLINDLLTLTRVTTKAKPFEPLELSRVLKDVLSDLEVRIAEKKAKVEVGNLPKIEADATQMRQLFQNLIGNALKFQKPGVPSEVKVEAEVTAGPGGKQCRIRVKDNGIGFDNKYAEQIFKVFERLHGRDEYEGTGIGLAVCRKVVERHGGTITAEGTPGQGSVFTVTLPLAQNAKGGKA